MKAHILTAVLLIFALTTFAQTSRRGTQERKSTTSEAQKKDNSRKTTQKSENVSTRQTVKPATSSRPTTRTQQPVVKKDDRSSRGNDNRNNRATNNNHGSTNHNNYKGNTNHGGNNHVVVKNQSRPHREYVHIVRPQRKVVVVHKRPGYVYHPVEYRRVHYPYRVPVHRDVIWTVSLYNDFRIFYPEVRVWRYNVGYRLPVISAYDADMYIGDVARVYGKVQDVYYDYDSDNYFLYIGDYYPYHDFTIVIPGPEARRFSRRPERYFEGSHVAVTGYISEFDNKPEVVIRRASQIDLY